MEGFNGISLADYADMARGASASGNFSQQDVEMLLKAMEAGSVTVKDTASGEESRITADTVILAMGVRSNRPEIDALRETFGDNLILVGDACKPGQIYDALHSAYNKAFVFDAA